MRWGSIQYSVFSGQFVVKYVPFEKYERLVRRLRKLIRGNSNTARRDALAVVLGLHGLRVSEVCNLNVGDLDLADGALRVATLKGGKVRTIRPAAVVVRELRRFTTESAKTQAAGGAGGERGERGVKPLLSTGTGGRVCRTHLERFFRELTGELFGGSGFKFHACRHTFAMRLYHNTKDVQRVRVRLGQRSVQATQVYVEAYGELDERRMERLGRVDVVPGLGSPRRHGGERRTRKRKRLGGAGGGGERVPCRTKVPSTQYAVPSGKKRVAHGENVEKRNLVRGKSGNVRAELQKATSEPLRIFRIEEFKSWAEQELAKSAEALKRSG